MLPYECAVFPCFWVRSTSDSSRLGWHLSSFYIQSVFGLFHRSLSTLNLSDFNQEQCKWTLITTTINILPTVSNSFKYTCRHGRLDWNKCDITHMYVHGTRMTKFHIKLVIKAITSWLYWFFFFFKFENTDTSYINITEVKAFYLFWNKSSHI